MHLGNTCCMPFQVDPTWQFLQCDILGGRGKLAISVPPLRGHVHKTSAKFSGFLTPPPPLHLHFMYCSSAKLANFSTPPPPSLQTSYVHRPKHCVSLAASRLFVSAFHDFPHRFPHRRPSSSPALVMQIAHSHAE